MSTAAAAPLVEVRPARDEDAAALAQVWERAWHDAHDGHVPDSLLRVRTADSFRLRAADLVPRAAVAVVDAGEGPRVVGFVATEGDEVEQLFVHADHRGTAVGAALLAEGVRRVRVAGHPQAWLAVVAGNERARRFYARHGFEDHGSFTYAAPGPAGPVPVPNQRYVRRLDVRPPRAEALDLHEHPEGGWYRQTWASPVALDLPDLRVRPTATLVLFWLPAGECSAWHRVASDEVWIALEGRVVVELGGSGPAPVPASSPETRTVDGEHPHVLVTAGVWQRTRPARDDALVSCLVSPGFDFADFELAPAPT